MLLLQPTGPQCIRRRRRSQTVSINSSGGTVIGIVPCALPGNIFPLLGQILDILFGTTDLHMHVAGNVLQGKLVLYLCVIVRI